MLQIIQEVLLETPGPSTAHCIAPESAVEESEMEVQAGHEPTRKVNSIAIQATKHKRYMLRQELVQRVSKMVLVFMCCLYIIQSLVHNN